uniref:non-specific protein-tyrosine kinase n=1 Tax=Branchiostoma floridae TaxID=7739 RepID=C3XPN6_BRAFL|eukprot:XP_002613898.1 hypothetical protein BRAFLDRAFT_71976 [Branchiostoma floridae]
MVSAVALIWYPPCSSFPEFPRLVAEPPTAAMSSDENPDWLGELLAEIQLEQFLPKIRDELHVTRLSHFDYVKGEDLEKIGMGKPGQRRLMEAIKRKKAAQRKSWLGKNCNIPKTSSVPPVFSYHISLKIKDPQPVQRLRPVLPCKDRTDKPRPDPQGRLN